MEAVRTSETSVDNHFTRQYIPEDNSEHHTRRRENLEVSHLRVLFQRYGSKLILLSLLEVGYKTQSFYCLGYKSTKKQKCFPHLSEFILYTEYTTAKVCVDAEAGSDPIPP
jgi:hypothetical protein